MMKLIVDENLLSFKVLEQKIFDYETKNLYQNGIWRSRVQENCISYKNGTRGKRLCLSVR